MTTAVGSGTAEGCPVTVTPSNSNNTVSVPSAELMSPTTRKRRLELLAAPNSKPRLIRLLFAHEPSSLGEYSAASVQKLPSSIEYSNRIGRSESGGCRKSNVIWMS